MAKKSTAHARDTYHVGNLAPLLLDAARALLDQEGPTRLSLRAVSERVGVSPTAAYHHYANRAELLGHLAAQGFRELAAALAARDSDADGHPLRAASLAYFRFARRNPALYQLMFGPEFAAGAMIPELRQAREESFGQLKGIIAELLRLDIGTPEVRSAALAGWSCVHGLASLAIHGVLQFPAGASDDRFVDRALQGFEYLFKAGQEPAPGR
ncbi:MAG: WHG domain-containing protein [Burkholderiaceae bacterium]